MPANGVRDARVVLASGPELFLVMTATTGTPPAVDVSGQGLGATVTVGGQTVRFDGQRIVFSR